MQKFNKMSLCAVVAIALGMGTTVLGAEAMKCGAGKCGHSTKEMNREGKCGDGKKAMNRDGKCGDGKKEMNRDGKCGDGKKKMNRDGKCGTK
jgi:uncharacterized low-complexity protein